MQLLRNHTFPAVVLLCLASLGAQAQQVSREQLVDMLSGGGYVILMRHASSPRQAPDATTRNADNVDGERQLDEAGRQTATEMGEALRRLGIPVEEVLSSPTYRAMETASRMGFDARPVEQLSNEGMRAAGAELAAWLQAEVTRPTNSGNRLLITHGPNLSAAFSDHSQGMTEGEALIFDPRGTDEPVVIHRLLIGDWAEL